MMKFYNCITTHSFYSLFWPLIVLNSNHLLLLYMEPWLVQFRSSLSPDNATVVVWHFIDVLASNHLMIHTGINSLYRVISHQSGINPCCVVYSCWFWWLNVWSNDMSHSQCYVTGSWAKVYSLYLELPKVGLAGFVRSCLYSHFFGDQR